MMPLLSGIFLSPIYLALLGILPLVVLLYILKLRRTEIIIPSTLLWRRSLQDLTANAPFQKLRNNLLLYLQLLILLLLILALSRPFLESDALSGNSWCVAIDCSASMQSKEGDTTRLELAKARALQLIDGLGSAERMMLISFADSADVLCEMTDDKQRLRAAVNGISPKDTPSEIGDVVQILRSLAPDNPDVATTIPDLQALILTDGKLSDPNALEKLSLPMQYLRIGEGRNNAGIVTFSLRKPDGGQQLDGAGAQQCLVAVYNDAETELTSTLSLYHHEAGDKLDEKQSLLAVEELRVAPGETRDVVFAMPELNHGLLRAELDTNDALDVDNSAWLALQADSTIRVALVGEETSAGLYFLQRAIGIDPRAETIRLNPADFAPELDADLFIFMGFVPEKLPDADMIFFNALPNIPGLELIGEMENPMMASLERSHPVMRFLNPESVVLNKAMRVRLPEGARALCSSQEGALIADISRGGHQLLLLTFDIADTDWPVHLSFPLFVQNVLNWGKVNAPGGNASHAAGEAFELLPLQAEGGAAMAMSAVATTPDGDIHTLALDPLRPVYFADTTQCGPYRIQRGTHISWLTVNLLDKNESAIAPAESLQLGQAELAAAQDTLRFNREYWSWLAACALALLCLEWWIYTRRAWY